MYWHLYCHTETRNDQERRGESLSTVLILLLSNASLLSKSIPTTEDAVFTLWLQRQNVDQWFSDSSFLEIPIFNLLFNLFSDMTVQFTWVPSFLPSLPHNV